MGRRRSDDRASCWRAGAAACARVMLVAAAQLAASGVVGVRLQAPAGAAHGQVVVVEEQPLLLSCESSAPLVMTYPLFLGAMPHLTQRRYTPPGATGDRWNTTLQVERALRQHTGFYNCSAINDPPPESVYIYVRSADGQYPWVKDVSDIAGEEMMGLYSAPLHGTAILDCRPNDPSTRVHLLNKAGKEMFEGKQPDGTTLSWDPRRGFALSPVGVEHTGTYRCLADEHPPELKLRIQVVATSLMEPTVRLEAGTQTLPRGADFSLSCELAVVRTLNFSLSWQGPDGRQPLNEGTKWEYFGNANEKSSWHRRVRTLNVFNASPKDAGQYTCTAQDAQGNKRSTLFKIQVTDQKNNHTKETEVNKTQSPLTYVASGNRLRSSLQLICTFLLPVTLSFLSRK